MADTTIAAQQEPAGPGAIWTPPPRVEPGAEMGALKRFHYDCEWNGTVQAGGMGPGSPEMKAVGKATFSPIMDGAWLVGDFEQEQFVDGAVAVKWQAHYVVGWSPQAGQYRVTYVDNNGSASLMDGRVENDQFVIETSGASPVKFQMVWKLLADGTVEWANRCSVNGGPWTLIEEYLCSPLSK
jgi:Protein of unknown function (DUF1579)